MTKRVAWAPDPPNNLGAVMATPGPMTLGRHLSLLTGRVQAMVDAEDEPRAALREVESMLLEAGMQPDLRRPEQAGSEIVAALEENLLAIGATTSRAIVPNRNSRAAREAMETRTLFDWVSQVLSS
jgi:hypothetical protein